MIFRAKALFGRLRKGQQAGQGLVEYALIILFIAIVVIVAVTAFGEQLVDAFELMTASFP